MGYIGCMCRSWLVRTQALLFATLLLAGGGGLPVLDAAFFHEYAPTHPTSPHLEASNGPHSHGELCRLSLALSNASPAVAPPGAISTSDFSYRALPRRSALEPLSAALHCIPQPRAPPTLSV